MTQHLGLKEVKGQAAMYALGALPKSEAGQFRQRLAAGCELCRGLVDGYREVTVAMALSAPEVQPPEGLRAKLMDRIGAAAAASHGASDSEMRLVRANGSPWKDSPMPGIQFRELMGQSTMLVRMAAGASYPPHDHKEAEQCLVLSGSISSNGVTAHAGDFVFMPKGSHHPPLFTETGCEFLIAYM